MCKKILIPVVIATLILGSCKTSQMTSYSDDIYTSPAEERALAQKQAEEKAKKDAEERKQQEEAVAAQKAKDDANPYYQDPAYNKDDYYDYQYASRLNRFSNPIQGAGYYDNYYTNTYTYNQNPVCYGTSIYSSYNYGMPSSQFSAVSFGISNGYYGNSFYGGNYCNPYGYNSFGYSNYGYNSYGYNGFGYDPYGYNNGFYSSYGLGYSNGYNQGYYNGLNSGWGYYNSYDVNSEYSRAVNAPRINNGGGNSGGRSSQGITPEDNSREKLFESVSQQQNSTPRFSNTSNGSTRVRGTNAENPAMGQSRNGYQNNNPNTNNGGGTRVRNRENNTPENNPGRTNSNSTRVTERQSEQTNPAHNNSGRSSNPSNSGGSTTPSNSSPRGGSGGGGGRPR